MPAIIRWFKVTHDINADPELWELRELYGDRAAFVWLEILSIADRNNGFLGPDSPQLRTILASKCRVYSPKVRAILGWCLDKGWLVIDDGFRVAKWSKYNKTRDATKIPDGKNKTPLLYSPIQSETDHLKSKRATQLPDDFLVSDELKAWARENQLPDPDSEIQAFRDYHQSKGSTFRDWNAALRTWLRNAKKFAGNGRPPLATSQVPAYKPAPDEPRPSKEQQAKIQKMLADLGDKMGTGKFSA